MDIKKPGPVKAHNFLKLNPVCGKKIIVLDEVMEMKARMKEISSLLVFD